jgi:hypothetical protein
MDFITPVERDLNDNVGGTTEPNEKQSSLLGYGGTFERTVPNQSATEQRSDVFIVETIGQIVSKILWHYGVLGISTVGIVTGITRLSTQILAASPTEIAYAVHMTKPCNPDPLSNMKSRNALADLVNPAHDLMARNYWISVQCQIAFDDMDIGPAHRTNTHLDSHFVRGGLRCIDLTQNQGRVADRSLLS